MQVYIQVENENDNVPLTESAVYYSAVPESSPSGTSVLQIVAEDKDVDPLQKLSYRITSGNPEGFFAINTTTGKYALHFHSRKSDGNHNAAAVTIIITIIVTNNSFES